MASFTAASQGNGVFSPAIWSKELIIQRESMLVMANNVLRLDADVAEQGYNINIPSVSNLSASAIGADGSLADQAPSEAATVLTLDQWMGVTINVPDILKVQSKYDLLKLYAEKMGYALGVVVEQKLLQQATNAANNFGSSSVDLSDANIRSGIQKLDEARAPMSDRHFIVTPAQKWVIYGIDKFIRHDAVGFSPKDSPIVKGDLGELYGLEIHMSPEITSSSSAFENLLWHKSAIGLAMQKDIKVEKFARTNFSDRMGASELYGVKTLRTDHMVWEKTQA